MTGFARRPDEIWGGVDWNYDGKCFEWYDPVVGGEGFEKHSAGVGEFQFITDPACWGGTWLAYVKPRGEGESKKAGGPVLRDTHHVTENWGPEPSTKGLVLAGKVDRFQCALHIWMILPPDLGGGRKELLTPSKPLWRAFDKFYVDWKRDKDKYPGIPTVGLVGTHKEGIHNLPIFGVVGRGERPNDLPDGLPWRPDPPSVERVVQPKFRLVVGGSPAPEPPDEEDPPPHENYPDHDPDYD